MSKECLKCGHINGTNVSSDLIECPKCQVIYEKYEAAIIPKALQLNVSVAEYARDLRRAEIERRQRAADVQREREAQKLTELEEKEKQQRDAEAQAAAQPTVQKKEKTFSPTVGTSSCRTCCGLVAIGAKMCPHCGQAKPAPKPPTQVTKKHLIIAAIVFLLFIFFGSSNQPSGVSTNLSAAEVVQRCARETGIDPNSSRAMTMQAIRAVDACVNRYGFKTKP